MPRLILIRHGESVTNADPDLHYKRDFFAQHVGLSRRGHAQARKCGAEVRGLLGRRPYTVFLSPYLRAVQTWAQISRALVGAPRETVTDGRLREQEFKDFRSDRESKAKKERASQRGRLFYRYKNAESGFDVLDRVGGFFNHLRFDLARGNRGGDALIVCHEIVIRCLLMLALDLPLEAFERLEIENCEVITLQAGTALRFEYVAGGASVAKMLADASDW